MIRERLHKLVGAAAISFALASCSPSESTNPSQNLPDLEREIKTSTPVAIFERRQPAPNLLSAGISPPVPPESFLAEPLPPIKHVVVIVIDQFRADFLGMPHPNPEAGTITPHLDAYAKGGAWATHVLNVISPETQPNHASLVSGMTPEKTGIRDTLCIGCPYTITPSIFTEAYENGLSISVLYGKPKLDILIPKDLEPHITIFGPGAHDPLKQDPPIHDPRIALESIKQIQKELPNLMVILLPTVDIVGHHEGCVSNNQKYAVRDTDQYIGEIIEAIRGKNGLEGTLIIFASDHGCEKDKKGDTSHTNDVPENRFVLFIAYGPKVGVAPGTVIGDQLNIYDIAPTVACALGEEIPAIWDGKPIMQVFPDRACIRE